MRRKDREVTDIREIEEILRLCKTCHVGMIDGDTPYVVPLNYGYRIFNSDTIALYFHSAHEGRKIDVLRRNRRVCFETAYEGEATHPENPCQSGYDYASVIGFGEAVFIEDTDEKREAIAVMYKHQTGEDAAFTAAQADTVCVFKIVSTDFTGKRKLRT